MVMEITELTLKRLTNYNAAVHTRSAQAQKHQWQQMSLEVMQKAERERQNARAVGAIVAYSLYLYELQNGLREPRAIYGEPALAQALARLLQELDIPIRQDRGTQAN